MDQLFQIDWSFVDRFGDNPFLAMLFFLMNGGWLLFIWLFGWGAIQLWKDWRQGLHAAKREFIVLAIDIPKLHEQGPRAVENAFAYLAGAHASESWTDTWIRGKTQDTISVEIVSIEGRVQFIMRTVRGFRDLCEASIFSQYPDAEISEVEDYATKVPSHYPDEEWDLWGTEMIPVKPDIYPLKTYVDFEDKVSGELKDPISALLEGFSRLGPGEQAWYQIVLTPIGQADFPKKSSLAVKKMKGEKVEVKKNMFEKAIDLPIQAISMIFEALLGGSGGAPAKKEEKGQPKILGMTQSEKDIIQAIENKASKINYLCKIRFVYVGKKQVVSKGRVVNPFIGALKQYNTNHMQSLKPDLKHVGMSGAIWWFKDRRNNARKNHLIHAYKARSNWSGMPAFHLSTEELASLWHFPHSLQVKAPQLKRTESKRSEPPVNIPFG